MTKLGPLALTVCSSAFIKLGRAQAAACGYPDLPIAVVPHPFSARSREQVRELAAQCANDIAKLVANLDNSEPSGTRAAIATRTALFEVDDDLQAINAFIMQQRWGDGLPVVPPTGERVAAMLRGSPRKADEVIARIAPGFGAASIERIAINAVMAGCEPAHLPVLIVQGRYDVICPPLSAYRLHQAWPGSTLRMIADAGHGALETGIAGALVAATEQFRRLGRFE